MIKMAYVRTFGALAYRDIRFIISGLHTRLIDGAIILLMQLLVIAKFLPLLGMPADLIAPLFIGTMTQIIFSASYGIAFRQVADLRKTRFINYQLMLPLPKLWLFAQFISSFMIEIAFISLPLLILGSIFLGSTFFGSGSSWLAVIAMYLISLFFYALFFIYLVFNSSYTWFMDNVWARRLSPLFLLGCSYYTWYKLYAFNAGIGILQLLNPLTYVHEGLRAALLGQEGFLPLWICLCMVIFWCIIMGLLLARAITKRLDPV